MTTITVTTAGYKVRIFTARASMLLGAISALFFFSAGLASAQAHHLDTFHIYASQQRRIITQPQHNENEHNSSTQSSSSSNSSNNNAGHAPAVGQRQEHLQEWMQNHKNLTVDQQVQALQQEPGFSQLPLGTQQRMVQRLRELNAMTPEQQQARTSNLEALERLTPQQRQQVRGALLAIGSMPEDRQRLVRKAFRDLREVPVEQRQAILNSDQFHAQFTDHERTVLHNLLAVEPYLPPSRPGGDVQFGGK